MINRIKLNEPIRIYFKYSNNSYSLFPLKVNDKFMLCASEYDFTFDGYTIRRLEDIEEIQTGAKYQEIVKNEKIFNDIEQINVKIDTWKDVFSSLYNLNENVIIECEDLDDNMFYIGKIEKVNDGDLEFKAFDNNAIWDKNVNSIKYENITSVTFKSRYINVFSKYAN